MKTHIDYYWRNLHFSIFMYIHVYKLDLEFRLSGRKSPLNRGVKLIGNTTIMQRRWTSSNWTSY